MADIQNLVRDTNSCAVFSGDVLVDLDLLPAGATEVDLTEALPKNKIILGGYLVNKAGDLAGGSTTIAFTVGSTSIVAATATSALKGTIKGALLSAPVIQGETDVVKLTIAQGSGGTAVGGKLVAKLLYV